MNSKHQRTLATQPSYRDIMAEIMQFEPTPKAPPSKPSLTAPVLTVALLSSTTNSTSIPSLSRSEELNNALKATEQLLGTNATVQLHEASVTNANSYSKQNMDSLSQFRESISASNPATSPTLATQQVTVVDNGYKVAIEYLQMQHQLTESKQEMDKLQDRMDHLGKELTDVREMIAFNPIK